MTLTLSPELEESILTQLEDGISLVKICGQSGIPSRRTVLRWQRENFDFGTKCAHAREAAGELAADKLDDINDKIESGRLEPGQASVISSNLKWRASKLASKKYGDRLHNVITSPDNSLRAMSDDQVAAKLDLIMRNCAQRKAVHETNMAPDNGYDLV